MTEFSGTSLSHYQILDLIGQGGMGRVYKAQDTRLLRHVAIKILSPDLVAEKNKRRRFIREAQTASSLNHPNICVIHEIDHVEDQHFIVMEFIEGETIRQRLQRLGRFSQAEALRIVFHVGEALSAVHKKGIFHRDIKPENIMLSSEGYIKILDFGLAKLAIDTAEERAPDQRVKTGAAPKAKNERYLKNVVDTNLSTLLGTINYMSPEQAQGLPVDHRSDIFSLGAVLYEMLAGQKAFDGKNTLATLRKIINEDPPPIRDINKNISLPIERLIQKAMQKSVHKRYQQIDEMLADVKTLILQPETTAMLKPAFILEQPDRSPTETVLCVGREPELALLQRHLDAAFADKGNVTFIIGEAGCGKSVLAQTFQKKALEQTNHLIIAGGKCDAQTGIGDPYLPFREILSQLTGDIEAMWNAGGITHGHALNLWNLLPITTQALVDCGADLIDTFISSDALLKRAALFGQTDWYGRLAKLIEQKKTAGSAAGLQQSDLFEQYSNVLHTISLRFPLFLFIDDLQWSDAGSISLLFHLGRRLANFRIFLLGAYRPAEISQRQSGERHPLEAVVNEFKQVYDDPIVNLDAVRGRAFIDALVDTEPNRLERKFRDTLYHQTEGHALFSVELLRAMQDQQLLVKDHQQRWIEKADVQWNMLPSRIDAVIGERLGRLPAELHKTLALAAIQGEEFIAEVIAQVSDIKNRDMVSWLSSELDKRFKLVHARGVERINGQRLSVYRFRHVLFQKYLYHNLDQAEREYWHEAVGDVLENLFGDESGEIAVHLARHFREAGQTEKAVHYLLIAAQRAKQIFANDEAISHYQGALDMLQRETRIFLQEQKRVTLLATANEGLGDMQAQIGNHQQAHNVYQQALCIIPQTDILWQSRVMRKIAKTHEVQRHFEEALAAFHQAEAILGEKPSGAEKEWWHEWIDVQIELIWHHYWLAQLNDMSKLSAIARPAIEKYGTALQRAKFFNNLTLLDFRQHRYVIFDETIEFAELALRASQEADNIQSISMSTFILGFALLWRGDFDSAAEQLQTAIDLSEQTGDIVLLSRCLNYLTITYRKQRNLENVSALLPRCFDIAKKGNMLEYEANAHANAAWLELQHNNLDAARKHAVESLHIWYDVIPQQIKAFQWTAIWPLIYIRMTEQNIEESVRLCEMLLDHDLQKMPDELFVLVQKIVQAWENQDKTTAVDMLNEALKVAKEVRYL